MQVISDVECKLLYYKKERLIQNWYLYDSSEDTLKPIREVEDNH